MITAEQAKEITNAVKKEKAALESSAIAFNIRLSAQQGNDSYTHEGPFSEEARRGLKELGYKVTKTHVSRDGALTQISWS